MIMPGWYPYLEQGALAAFGLTAIFLVAVCGLQWGCCFGLVSQPFWISTALRKRQAGVLILSVVYSVVWSLGVIRWIYG